MKIKLLDYRVVDLRLQASEQDSHMEMASNDLSLEVGQFYPDDEKNIFGIGFKVFFGQEGFNVKAEMRFFFEIDSVITEDFKNGPFPAINAPAIAFPYLRSFLSILTMQAGYAPVMIPSVNFVEFAKRAVKNETSNK